MEDWLERTRLLWGDRALDRLARARVAVLGLGGVGSAVVEGLGRAGVGHILGVDQDCFSPSNRNRQLLATAETVGRAKCQVAGERLRAINPRIDYQAAREFYLPENRDFLFAYRPTLVVDAIDTVTAKIDLAVQCRERGIPLLACLGTGNRNDPSQLRLGTIADTAGSGCPLARVMRRELRRRGILDLPVVYSLEGAASLCAEDAHGRHSPASGPFVPPAAGLLLAYGAVKTLLSLPDPQPAKGDLP